MVVRTVRRCSRGAGRPEPATRNVTVLASLEVQTTPAQTSEWEVRVQAPRPLGHSVLQQGSRQPSLPAAPAHRDVVPP